MELQERFERQGRAVIDFAGAEVFWAYHCCVPRSCDIEIRAVRFRGIEFRGLSWLYLWLKIAQGIRIDVVNGEFGSEEAEVETVEFWPRRKGDSIRFRCDVLSGRHRIIISNCWRVGTGRVRSFEGNAGMQVTPTGHLLRVQCSDGIGPVDFDDLVVDISFVLEREERVEVLSIPPFAEPEESEPDD